MKIVHKDLRHGAMKLVPESPEDLWVLSTIIHQGDDVRARTLRKVKSTGSEERAKDSAKIPMMLTLTVEKVEFAPPMLRILGAIKEGPDDIPRGTYHSFSIDVHDTCLIVKKHWSSIVLKKVEESTHPPVKILLCVFDREEAYIALVKNFSYELLVHLKGDVQKKGDVDIKKGNFYAEIIRALQEYTQRLKTESVILASPSFWKEELLKELHDDTLRKQLIQATCSSVDERAMHEVLRRDEVRHALRNSRMLQEASLVERLLGEMRKQGPVAYGWQDVQSAIDAGAVAELLITDELLREQHERAEAMLLRAEQTHAQLHLIHTEHEPGKRLHGLGGIAAFLRFRLNV
ncbi:mRNA surveillance protein pelota [Candidatus Woesearchaeota archaeon]|nr:mRNA surveillance protein pelota [Candidatus Woesearchaeota archaeon]